MSYFSKTASPWCFWFLSTVTECRSRWIIPSIQTTAIVILKEQTYVAEWNVDHFKGMMKAQCWIVQKEAPLNGEKCGIKGGKGERKRFQTIPISSVLLQPSFKLYIFTLLLFALSVVSTLLISDDAIWLRLGLLQWLLIIYLCLQRR